MCVPNLVHACKYLYKSIYYILDKYISKIGIKQYTYMYNC